MYEVEELLGRLTNVLKELPALKSILLRDETEFASSLGIPQYGMVYFIFSNCVSTKSILVLQKVIRRMSLKTAMGIDSIRFHTENILKDRGDGVLLIYVWDEQISKHFLQSVDYSVQLNLVLNRGHQLGATIPVWKVRKVSPEDLVVSTEEGIITYQQVLREAFINNDLLSLDKTRVDDLLRFSLVCVLRNVLTLLNQYPNTCEQIKQGFLKTYPFLTQTLTDFLQGFADRSAEKSFDMAIKILQEITDAFSPRIGLLKTSNI